MQLRGGLEINVSDEWEPIDCLHLCTKLTAKLFNYDTFNKAASSSTTFLLLKILSLKNTVMRDRKSYLDEIGRRIILSGQLWYNNEPAFEIRRK